MLQEEFALLLAIEEETSEREELLRAGKGKGNWGHAGRKGMVGGSSSDNIPSITISGKIPGNKSIKLPSSAGESASITLYHGSSADVISKILADGILPVGGKVWMTDNLSTAAEYADLAARTNSEDRNFPEGYNIVIFKVEIPESEVEFIQEGNKGQKYFNVINNGKVNPEYIVSYGTNDMYKGYKNTTNPDTWAWSDPIKRSQKTKTFYVPILLKSPAETNVGRNFNEELILILAVEEETILRGGEGSGNFGHAGREGEVGGSGGGGGTSNLSITTDDRATAALAGTPLKDKEGVDKFCNSQIPKGYTGEFEVLEGNDSSVRIYTKVIDENGDVIATSKRVFRKDGVVEHDGFEMRKEDQGKGLGAEIYKNSEKAYMDMGITSIKLTANESVGGYAWARMGFDFADKNAFYRAQVRAENMWERTYMAMRKTLGDNSFKFKEDYIKMPEFNHSWELASMTSPWDKEQHFGKTALLGSAWDASKDLSEDSLGKTIGDTYYAASR